ncbi:MAG: sigma 54-interacting transcriptional regulator [Candidatus Cloacimonetes bacterium]|nr:sigma 54-interacting transcriptional regulator [Candidatus Cloacimonadota bacterium]
MNFVLVLALSELSINPYLVHLKKKYTTASLEAGDPVTTMVYGDDLPISILYFSSFSEDYSKNLKALRSTYPGIPLIVIHDLDHRIKRRDIAEQFADAVVEKPVPSFIVDIIDAQIRKSRNLSLKSLAVNRPTEHQEQYLQISEKMQKLMRIASKVAPTDATILLTGESGTGKEVTANWIHSESLRKQKPFVAINCGAITETILESELFGHKRGSFTGADRDKTGLFEAADQGTLFLDEIGEMPFSLQVKLLRVIQERKIRKVGDIEDIPVNVRIIAATNKDLMRLVREERFREDLYYRLNVVHLHLPPLRERKESLPGLVMTFLLHYAQKYKKSVQAVSPACENILMQYAFPGNIRELQNIIEYSVIMCESQTLQPQDLPIELQRDAPMNLLPAPATVTELPPLNTLHDFLSYVYHISNPSISDVEKILIEEKLAMYQSNQKQVSDSLGISRTSLWRKLKELRIG